MTVAELLKRARAQAKLPTIYGLGRGRTLGPDPRDETGACDCSAYVCWCLDIRKSQPALAWLRNVNGGWYNTDGIWWDATKEATGFFEAIPAPRPGCVVVYPSSAHRDKKTPPIGQIGIVTEVTGNSYRVIHCSNGNYKNFGDAIRETGPAVFLAQPAATFAWAAPVVR